MNVHNLKIWPQYFSAFLSGEKTFEYRINDRNFQVGDILRLFEYQPTFKTYTGRTMERKITYIIHLENKHSILALSREPP